MAGTALVTENETVRFYNGRTDNEVYIVEQITVQPKYLYSAIKRCFDLVFVLVGLIVCVIPIVVIAIAIKVDSRGPIFFCQERLGLNGRPFMMYKFRSMREDAEKDGPQWAEPNDDRCTQVGIFLRKTRLDEIPQLFNILRGDMSFVGPRPERAVFYREFEQYIVGFSQRMLVKPGLTGHAQVNGGYDLLPEEKILFDIEYIKQRSVSMDLKCLLKTIIVVFSHEGAR